MDLEGRRIEGGAHDDQFEVRTVGKDLLDHAENDIGGERALVNLIEDDDIVLLEKGIGDGLSQEHTIRDIFQHRLVARLLLETDRVANLRSALHIHFFRNTPCNTCRCHSPRLCTCDVWSMVQIGIQ